MPMSDDKLGSVRFSSQRTQFFFLHSIWLTCESFRLLLPFSYHHHATRALLRMHCYLNILSAWAGKSFRLSPQQKSTQNHLQFIEMHLGSLNCSSCFGIHSQLKFNSDVQCACECGMSTEHISIPMTVWSAHWNSCNGTKNKWESLY